MARLVFQVSDQEKLDLDLTSEPVTIGRARDNTVVIDNLWISSHHARLQAAAEPGRFEMVDLASHNGTFVNGERVESKVLEHGDRIKLGQLEAVFEDDQPPAQPRIQPMRPAGHLRGTRPSGQSRPPIPPRPTPLPRRPPAAPPSETPPEAVSKTPTARLEPAETKISTDAAAAAEAQKAAADAQARAQAAQAAAEKAEKRKAGSQSELRLTDEKIGEARAVHAREIAAVDQLTHKQASLREETLRLEQRLGELRNNEAIGERAVRELQEQRSMLEADVEAYAEKLKEKAMLVSGIASLQTQCASLRQEIENAEAKRAQAAALANEVAALQKNRAALAREIDEQEEVRRTMQEAPDPSWGTVHLLAKGIIKRLDWIEDMIAACQARDPRIAQQLRQLRDSMLEWLHENSIIDYTFPVGTRLDIATRKKIQIMESTNGTGEITEILEVYRPGYLCTNGSAGVETLLRKAEVKTGRR